MTIALLLLLALLPHGHAAEGVVGGRCSSGSQRCEDPHADCIEGICLCSSFYRFHNGSCVSFDDSATLGRPCLGGGDCRGVGEFCSSFAVCMCLSTHVDVGTQCKPAVYPGQFGCEDSRQCNKGFPGAECDASRICVCPHGMISAQQTCIVSSTISNVILSDDHRRHRARRPPANYYRRRYSQVFAQQPSPGIAPDAVCSADSDCAGYPLAFCDGVCRCASGALNAGSTCISSGDALRPAGSCPPGQTYVTEAGACMTVQQPGDPCQYSQQCSAVEAGAFCLRLRCECVYGMRQSGTGCTYVDKQCTEKGYIWISELGECRKVLAPGERGCSHNLQCTGAYPEATCFLQTCTCPASIPVAIDGTCGINCPSGQTYSGVTGQCLPTVKPGDQCLYSSQCHAVNPGMICDRGLCRCPSGLVYSGTKCTEACPAGYIVNSKGLCMPGCRVNQVEFEGECLDQVAPEQPCAVNAQCTGGSSCQNGLCRCPKAMVARGSSCVQAESQPSGSCSNGELCIGGSFCSNGACICPVGKQIVNNQCITPQAVPPNSPCNPSVACSGGSTCIANVCQCPSNQQIIDDRCQVPPSVPPGSPCPSGFERCLGQSMCVDGVCQCPFGTYSSQGECVPVQSVPAGAPCSATTLCSGLAQCIDGTCQCPAGLVVTDGDCRAAAQVGPGSNCAMGQVCAGGSSCIGQVCTCPVGTQAVSGICQPLISVSPGQPCAQGDVCTGGSNCQDGLCLCPLGTMNVQGTCQEPSESLGICSDSSQCSGGSYCNVQTQQCLCPENTVNIGKICIPNQQLSLTPSEVSVCTYDNDCMDGRVCVLKKCQCMFGENFDGSCRNLWNSRKVYRDDTRSPIRPSRSRFLKPARNVDIGGGCVKVGVACGGGSICVAGYCVCPPGMTEYQNRCVEHRTAQPGESCDRGEECVGESTCDRNTYRCECISPTKLVIGGVCRERLRSHPGYPCGNGEMCVGGSTCIDARCACSDGKIEVNKQCVDRPTVGAGETCGNGENCGGGSECDYNQKKCICRRGQVVVNQQCVQVTVVNPGASCKENLVRCGGGSYCVRGRCECPATMLPVESKCVMTKQVPPGHACSVTEICQGKSLCKDGYCQCSSDMILVGNECRIRRKILPLESCHAGDECMGNSKCNGHVCECDPGHVVRDGTCQQRLTRNPGQRCNQEDLCIGLSVCAGGICQCRPGEKPISGTCTKIIEVLPGGACEPNDECQGGSSCRGGICMCPAGQTIVAGRCKEIVRVPPGTACSNGEICDGGSYCHPNTKLCRCPPGEMIGGNKCMKVGRRIPQIVPVLPRGRTPMSNSRPICRSNSECPKGAMCRNGLCACPQFTELRNGTCRPVTIDPARRRPGLLKEPCQTDSQCAVVNSYCSEIGVCGCLPGYRIFGSTQCIRRYVPSTTTTTTTTTTTASPSTTTTFSTTTSSRRTTSRPVEELLLPGSACNERSLCHYGSTCVQGRCRCPAGFAQIHNTCVRRRPNTVVPPLSSCAAGEICGGGSECIYSLCFCTDDRTLFRGECKTLIEIDEIRANEIVQIKATTVRLQRLRTTTPSTPTPSTGTIFTKLSTTTSAPTTSKSTQPPTKATTTTTPRPSTSRPPVSTTPSEPETIEIPKINTKGVTRKPVFWFKIARPGFECDEHTFCTNCSVCVGGLCACPEGLELVGEKCLSPVDAKSCLASNQCPSGAECVGGECRCSPGLALSRFGFCMPLTYVDPGMSCSEGETCRGGSECREGMCVCSEGLFIRNNKCMPAVRERRALPAISNKDLEFLNKMRQAEQLASTSGVLSLGDRCSSTSRCPDKGKCIRGICRCTSGYVQAGHSCILRTATKASDSCSNGEQCSHGSICVSGKCICPKGFASVEGSCVSIGNVAKSPGISCLLNPNICTGGSTCVSGICTCPFGTVNVNGICTATTGGTTYSPPGGPCTDGQVVCTGNSVCANGFCVCPGGEQIRNNICIAIDSQADPGQMCQEEITVCTGNSFCQTGVCRCPQGQTSLNGQCTRVITVTNIPCNPTCGINSQCISGSCVCNQGYSYSNGVCQPNCNPPCGSNSNCQAGQCQCNPGFFFSNGVCQLGCNPSCGQNSYCQQGTCQCNQGYSYSNGVCQPSCTPSCGQNSYCQQGNCVCNQGYSYSNGICQPSCNPPCGSNAYCQQGTCQCNPGYSYSNGICQLSCNPPCGANSFCLQGTCQCNAGFSYSNGICQPSCNPPCGSNSYCQESTRTCQCNTGYSLSNGICEQTCNPACSPNAYCSQGSCHCNPGYSMTNIGCQPSCNPSCGSNSYCQQGTCACNPGYTYTNGACQPSCNPQCPPNSCNPTYNPGGGFCNPTYLAPSPFYGLPGQPCDMRVGAMLCRERALCVGGQCVCPTNLVLSVRRCVEFAGDVYPGGSCLTPGTICRGGSVCSGGTCKCEAGYIIVGNQCTRQFTLPPVLPTPPPYPFYLRPGEPCDIRCLQGSNCLQMCFYGSYCDSTTALCTCPIGTYASQGSCVPFADAVSSTLPPIQSARPNDPCDSNVICSGGSSCILGTCRCPTGYSPSSDRLSCVLSILPQSMRSYPGGKCSKDNECTGNSICQNGICSCLRNEEIQGSECILSSLKKYPGSPCGRSDKCVFGSVCQQGFCLCPHSTTTNSSGHCVSIVETDTAFPLPGGSCRIGGSACEPSSVCVDGHCRCPKGTSNDGKNRCVSDEMTFAPNPQAFKRPNPNEKSCTSYQDCDAPRTCSSMGKCECPFTMIANEKGICRYRTGIAPPGSWCDNNGESTCKSPSHCLANRCVCPAGFIEKNFECVLTNSMNGVPGAKCSSTRDCGSGAICEKGICTCKLGMTPDRNACKTVNKRDLVSAPAVPRLTSCPSDGSCKLPNCFCSRTGTVPPGGLESQHVPQMVILTFDDPITDRTINIYKSMFSGKFRNPNGCPIKGTFFISHQFNNYDQTQWLYSRGNEIALNSITHENLFNASSERWRHEMVGLRDSLKAFSYVDESTVIGVRAPHLLIGGDQQFDMMKANGLVYDNSMPVREGPVWPQTLDHRLAWDCGEQKCPQKSHPGIWSIPLQLIASSDGIWHTMARTAIKPYDTRESVLRLLQRNFYRNYNGNRAPFVLTADSEFLTYLPDNGVVHALEDWLREILGKTDVYVVTGSQAIEWMKKPTSSRDIEKFKRWQCNFRMNDHVHPCENPSICSYDSRSPTGLPHSFRVCGSCPKTYPWIEDPLGRKHLRRK